MRQNWFSGVQLFQYGLPVHLPKITERFIYCSGDFYTVDVLKKSSSLCPAMLLEQADAVRLKHRSTKYIDRLVEHIKTLPKSS